MLAPKVFLHLLLTQAHTYLPPAQAGGQQHSHGGGAVQQGGDAMGGEEVGAEDSEGGK